MGTALEGVGLPIVRQAHVTHLRMEQPVHQLATYHAAAADARADGKVEERIQSLRRAPTVFAERCAVDVSIEAHRQTERATDGAGQVGIGPARLGRSRNVTKSWGSWVGINRAKRGDANRGQLDVFCLVFEEGDGPADGFLRCRRRETDF